jgi:hypothetical protein
MKIDLTILKALKVKKPNLAPKQQAGTQACQSPQISLISFQQI